MNIGGLHLHSMMVHAVIALALLAAGSYVFAAGAVVVGGLGPAVWTLLLRGGLLGVLAIALPATFTGITEHNHMYATWHRSHQIKLVLSLLLVVVCAAALAALAPAPLRIGWWPAVAVVLVIPALVLALAGYGLRITLGRASLARTSYLPDMLKDPPVDILELAAEHAAEDPRLVDPTQELST